MVSFFWLYRTINVSDFRLIPLDRNTYVNRIRNETLNPYNITVYKIFVL